MSASSLQAPVLSLQGLGSLRYRLQLNHAYSFLSSLLFLVSECQDIEHIDRRFIAVEGHIA
ncbi:hypothetical protein Q669_31425 [Labrenzia sp. C1B10]|nr:hypothetical protein Q669_31425 [Labrenzia sp. C1B10]ERS09595.1 hypothetical protein Q675_00255 [Labrenzia sp. C1B70]QFT01682.1 hypothetical protein FIV06_29895 [Labrenzia sp. THAF191b]QFT07887.1 hypothetical protein FIV05_29345 [Labrenzia sp. THAF191a]QFT19247.1 hypothetical protein FIV03_28440 [Labrenzia sp. THAF187b]